MNKSDKTRAKIVGGAILAILLILAGAIPQGMGLGQTAVTKALIGIGIGLGGFGLLALIVVGIFLRYAHRHKQHPPIDASHLGAVVPQPSAQRELGGMPHAAALPVATSWTAIAASTAGTPSGATQPGIKTGISATPSEGVRLVDLLKEESKLTSQSRVSRSPTPFHSPKPLSPKPQFLPDKYKQEPADDDSAATESVQEPATRQSKPPPASTTKPPHKLEKKESISFLDIDQDSPRTPSSKQDGENTLNIPTLKDTWPLTPRRSTQQSAAVVSSSTVSPALGNGS